MFLLIEDIPDGEALTLRALRKDNILGEVVVAHDGAETLDYLFGAGAYAECDVGVLLEVVLLDSKLPKLHGLEALRQVRGNENAVFLPMAILTSSRGEQDLTEGHCLGANRCIHKTGDFTQCTEAVRQLGLRWSALNEPPSEPR